MPDVIQHTTKDSCLEDVTRHYAQRLALALHPVTIELQDLTCGPDLLTYPLLIPSSPGVCFTLIWLFLEQQLKITCDLPFLHYQEVIQAKYIG